MTRKILIGCLFLIYSVLGLGCPAAWLVGGAAVGIGVYAYSSSGELERKYPVGFDKAWQTSVSTLEQLQFTKEDSKRDGLSGSIEAKRADGTPIHIAFELVSDRVTSIKIKIGMFGDRQISELIHDRIRENLGLSNK
jgi:hypothetical protein